MRDVHRTAAILAIGDELITGQKLDTNSRWLSDRLTRRGVAVRAHVTVADDQAAIVQALRALTAAHDLVLVTGGLGPTADDLTRPALAELLDEPLVEDATARGWLEAAAAEAGRPLLPASLVQAHRPRSARLVRNDVGTAPGLIVPGTADRADVICLPGPPAELVPMFDACIAQLIRPAPGQAILTEVVQCYGLAEPEVAARLGELMDRHRNPLVGTTPSGGLVSVRVRFQGQTDIGRERLDETVRQIRDRLGWVVFATGERTLAEAVIDLLRAAGKTVSSVESCTGGLLGAMLTAVAGASDVYVGGWVTYTNRLKTELVGVPEVLFSAPDAPGAVSRTCAEAMASGALARCQADHALAITGIAGPGGGSPRKPVGTVWIALAWRETGSTADARCDSRCFRFPGDREFVRRCAAMSALAMLRLHLIDHRHVRLFGQIDADEGGT